MCLVVLLAGGQAVMGWGSQAMVWGSPEWVPAVLIRPHLDGAAKDGGVQSKCLLGTALEVWLGMEGVAVGNLWVGASGAVLTRQLEMEGVQVG